MAIRRPQRRYNKTPMRRKEVNAPGGASQITRRTPIIPDPGAAAGNTIPVVLTSPCSLNGVPQFLATVAAAPAAPVSAVMTTPLLCTLTYSGAPTSPLVIPFEDPALRNNAGGYVQPGTYTFP